LKCELADDGLEAHAFRQLQDHTEAQQLADQCHQGVGLVDAFETTGPRCRAVFFVPAQKVAAAEGASRSGANGTFQGIKSAAVDLLHAMTEPVERAVGIPAVALDESTHGAIVNGPDALHRSPRPAFRPGDVGSPRPCITIRLEWALRRALQMS